jgi:predicted dehydrogenase
MGKQTRRSFLEETLVAASAAMAAVKYSESEPAYAAETQVKGPNEVLRAAVIGVRGRGGSHIQSLSELPGVEVTAICDVDEAAGNSRLEEIQKKSGKKPKFYRDLRDVISDQNIDIVSIATPNHWHSLAGIWAVQAGKDVYVEKPVSHNVSEGRRLVQAARKYERIVQTGTQCRSAKAHQDAVQFLKDGHLGEVTLARGICHRRRGSIGPRGDYPIPESVDYDLYIGPAEMTKLTRPKFHYDWHWQWNCGNGDIGNQGIHQMDLARWGLGEDKVSKSVVSFGGRLGYTDAGEVANSQIAFHNYGKKQLIFEVKGLEVEDLHGVKVGVIFYGSEGYLVMDSYTHAVAFDKDWKIIKHFKTPKNKYSNIGHFANFEKAVRSRNVSDLNADILEGHLSSALCHLGNISYNLGEKMPAEKIREKVKNVPHATESLDRMLGYLSDNKVDVKKDLLTMGPALYLNPNKEKFVGPLAVKANPLLTREYRKPFIVPAEKEI